MIRHWLLFIAMWTTTLFAMQVPTKDFYGPSTIIYRGQEIEPVTLIDNVARLMHDDSVTFFAEDPSDNSDYTPNKRVRHPFLLARVIVYNSDLKLYQDYGPVYCSTKNITRWFDLHEGNYYFVEHYRLYHGEWIGALVFDAPAEDCVLCMLECGVIMTSVDNTPGACAVYIENEEP